MNDSFSLLWLHDDEINHCPTLPASTFNDLHIGDVVAHISTSGTSRRFFSRLLQQLPTNAKTIAHRQEVLTDFVKQPQMTKAIAALLPKLDGLRPQPLTFRDRHAIFDVIERIGELDLFLECVNGFHAALSSADKLQSTGLQQLHRLIVDTTNDPRFTSLQSELPELQATVQQTASVTIGVNLDHNLRPHEATLLAINGEKFSEASMLDRLFGREDEFSRLGNFHRAGEIDGVTMARIKEKNSPLMTPLFADLAELLEAVSRPVANVLKKYGKLATASLVKFRDELAFYVTAAEMVEQLRGRGLEMVRPEILPTAERTLQATHAYNLHLALSNPKAQVVTSNINMGDEGRIFILTGPNGGGKTTFLQSVGLVQLFGQLGLYVPATAASISPADNIYTHYQGEERPEAGTGRFGEEAVRLQKIFVTATAESLILLNESLASTSTGESLYIAQDIVQLFRQMDVRAIFATHLHQLAANVKDLNQAAGAGIVVSLVASSRGAEDGVRTFEVVVGEPLGRSYAKELAIQYGIDAGQLTALLTKRGVIN
ncbi:MAG: hypothetical protein AAF702_37410 [Chloroflexota bacterium]